MRLFSSEFAHSYGNYAFGFCNYAERQPGDSLESVYSAGYLPYSGSKHVLDTFYMARSVRLALSPDFPAVLGKERSLRVARRLDGRFDAVPRTVREAVRDAQFIPFVLDYFQTRHGEGVMPRERLEAVLGSGLVSRVIEYRERDRRIAYSIEVGADSMSHVWYTCYALELADASMGTWLMLDAARRAHEEKKTHLYLGTAYGDRARYKLKFPCLQFWSGGLWVEDTKGILMARLQTDERRAVDCLDEWKATTARF